MFAMSSVVWVSSGEDVTCGKDWGKQEAMWERMVVVLVVPVMLICASFWSRSVG
jgi:hypothetical protein